MPEVLVLVCLPIGEAYDVSGSRGAKFGCHRATLIDATVAVAAVGISGGAAGAVTTRLGTGIASSAITAGAAGGALDAAVQAGQLSTYTATSGQAGNQHFSGTEFGTSVVAGVVLGGVGRAASDVSIGVGRGGVTVTTPNQSYRLQSPIYPAGSPYQLNSGVPIGVRSPLAPLGLSRGNVPNTTATSIGKSGYASVQEFSDAAYTKYQGFVDEGYAAAKQDLQDGRCGPARDC
ncbi:hypothetical protein ACVWWJ_001876 [Luteibacter sp. HA06]